VDWEPAANLAPSDTALRGFCISFDVADTAGILKLAPHGTHGTNCDIAAEDGVQTQRTSSLSGLQSTDDAQRLIVLDQAVPNATSDRIDSVVT